MDYLLRQAKVEEEMKAVLKSYFKNKEITKDEYKNILKKAVPQVCIFVVCFTHNAYLNILLISDNILGDHVRQPYNSRKDSIPNDKIRS